MVVVSQERRSKGRAPRSNTCNVSVNKIQAAILGIIILYCACYLFGVGKLTNKTTTDIITSESAAMKSFFSQFKQTSKKNSQSTVVNLEKQDKANNIVDSNLPQYLRQLQLQRNKREHPHAGATFEDGITPGYIHDPTILRRFKTYSLHWNHSLCPTNSSDFLGLKGLRKVRQGIIQRAKNQAKNTAAAKIFCAVYTHSEEHKSSLASIINTWAPQCDGFLASSNVTNITLAAVNILHQGDEEYKNMWQKVRSTFAYIYDNYLEEYDYFHICGDDTYLVVDNFRSYLEGPQVSALRNGHIDIVAQKNAQANHNSTWSNFYDKNETLVQLLAEWKRDNNQEIPLLLGLPWDRNKPSVYYHFFPLGGPGYTLNRAALKFLVEFAYWEYDSNIMTATDPREDVFIGGIFFKYGIHCADTRDEKNAWRYQVLCAAFAETGKSSQATRGFKQKFGVEIADFLDVLSDQTISFHLKPYRPAAAVEMERYHMILNGICET
mmetsp:Transcript_24808/g.35575  ORF Transcript_24808/g.35575 Transcript_24808/m.35575 type:complete len:493 (+) Transcript_24808:32-1510(+)